MSLSHIRPRDFRDSEVSAPSAYLVDLSALFLKYILLSAVFKGSFKSATDCCLSVLEIETKPTAPRLVQPLGMSKIISLHLSYNRLTWQSVYIRDKRVLSRENVLDSA